MKIILVVILAAGLLAAQTKKPEWVERRPADRGYYIGIGSVAKDGSPQEYRQRAKDAAALDIAQQIAVAVEAEQLSTLTEKMGELTDEFRSAVKTSTTADLDEVETVDTWDGGDSYWVYERLSIEAYKKRAAEKKNVAVSLGRDLFVKARRAEEGARIAEAMQAYVQALSAVGKYIGSSMEVSIDGKTVMLSNEIFSSLQSLLNAIELLPKEPKIGGQVGKSASAPLMLTARTVRDATPVGNLPLSFRFLKGSGDIAGGGRTDKNGAASAQVLKITGTDKVQIIRAEPDLFSFAGQGTPLLATILKGFSLPAARFTLTVSSLAVSFETEETMSGAPLRLPRIEPVLKNSLASEGFTFVDDPSRAAMLVTIRANGRDGGEYNGLYSAYVDANISVTDLSSGEEVYKTSYNNVKGVSITGEKAVMKAYDEIAERLKKTEIPKILAQLKK